MPDPILRRIASHARRHGAPAPGERVLAMVSGGPDSTLLMHALAALHDGPVGVLTVDHGLRPEAAGEAAAVIDAAAALGLPASVARLRLVPGPGVHARAREARYAAAREVAARDGWDVLATGHTATDQAETVLMRLARGAGRTGAVGMAARSGDLARPLLCLTAAETRAWCAERGVAVADDPSNRDPAATRVRARGLVAGLASLHGGAERHVAAFADLMRDEAEVLAPVVDAAWTRCSRGGGLDAAGLAAEPDAMRRLLVRRLLAGAGLSGDALSAAAVARVLAMPATGARTELAGGAVVLERGVLLALPAAAAEPAPGPVALPVPGAVRFGALTLRGALGVAGPPTPTAVALHADGPLEVRAPRPGDRLALPGGGHARVGRLLAERGVPARLRHLVPVVATGGRPLWVAGHRADADALAAPGEPAVLLEALPA